MWRFLSALLLTLAFATPGEAANRYATCNTTCTWDASDTSMWGTASGGTGASVPGSSDAVILDTATCVGGTTCTITVNTTVTVQSITMGTCTASTTGCILDFSVNNNNVTLSAAAGLSCTGTGTRQLKMGSGTWSFTGIGIVVDFTTTTNLTLSAASVTIALNATGTASAQNMTVGTAQSFGTLSVGGNSTGGIIQLTGPSSATLTFANLSFTAPRQLHFTGAGSRVYAFTNGFSVNGSSGSYITLIGSTGVTFPTISSANAMTCTWCAIGGLSFAGGGSLTGTSSFDLGGVTVSGGGSKSINPPTGGGGRVIGG
ncbi:MAG: hypothetical protein IT481_08515 [Gammaproteobacteria bacterium]|nr:hypothetical protein [Gammaproteobacteria bacterium]